MSISDKNRKRLLEGDRDKVGKSLLPKALRRDSGLDLRLVLQDGQQLLVLFRRQSYLKPTWAPGALFRRVSSLAVYAVRETSPDRLDRDVAKLARRARKISAPATLRARTA